MCITYIKYVFMEAIYLLYNKNIARHNEIKNLNATTAGVNRIDVYMCTCRMNSLLQDIFVYVYAGLPAISSFIMKKKGLFSRFTWFVCNDIACVWVAQTNRFLVVTHKISTSIYSLVGL